MSGRSVQERWRKVSARAAEHAESCELHILPVELGNPCARYAKLQMSSLDGAMLSARLIAPAGKGPHPVVLAFHDANRGVRGWQHLTRYVALGCAVVALRNRPGVEGVLVREPLSVGDGLGVAMRLGTEEAPRFCRQLDAETRQALAACYTDALVLAHATKRLDCLDAERLLCCGEGLGAGLALVVGSLVPTLAVAALSPLPAALDASAAEVDVMRISQGLGCPVLLGSCLLDLQATPESQDALAEGLSCVRHLRYPRYAHERVNAFEDELLSFLVAQLAGSENSPEKF